MRRPGNRLRIPSRRRRSESRLGFVLRARHFFRLSGDLLAYAAVNRAWWVPALTLVLALAALLITIGQAAAPVTLYPLF